MASLNPPPPPRENINNMPKYVSDLREKMWHKHEVIRENMIKANDRQRKNYDGRSKVQSNKPGNLA